MCQCLDNNARPSLNVSSFSEHTFQRYHCPENNAVTRTVRLVSASDGQVQQDIYNEKGNQQYKYYYSSVDDSKSSFTTSSLQKQTNNLILLLSERFTMVCFCCVNSLFLLVCVRFTIAYRVFTLNMDFVSGAE